ncbi:hypothetical protein ACSQ67_023844 [Phaseolus vulgaris]
MTPFSILQISSSVTLPSRLRLFSLNLSSPFILLLVLSNLNHSYSHKGKRSRIGDYSKSLQIMENNAKHLDNDVSKQEQAPQPRTLLKEMKEGLDTIRCKVQSLTAKVKEIQKRANEVGVRNGEGLEVGDVREVNVGSKDFDGEVE